MANIEQAQLTKTDVYNCIAATFNEHLKHEHKPAPIDPFKTATGAAILAQNIPNLEELKAYVASAYVKQAMQPPVKFSDFCSTAQAQTPKHNPANSRIMSIFEAVKYATRLMSGISFTVSETSFQILIKRYGSLQAINVNAFNGSDFFIEIKYADRSRTPRTAGYSTLAMACADITALAMYYAIS